MDQSVVGYKLKDVKTGEILRTWGGVWGQCPGIPSPLSLPNGVDVWSPKPGNEYAAFLFEEWKMDAPPLTSKDVNNERDRRTSEDFDFNGKRFQFRESDRENINGAGTLAALAIMGGAQPGDYKWHGGKEDFVWITSDNSLMPLDAFDTVNLGKAAAAWKSAHIFAARALKDQDPIPANYQDDAFWPPKAELA